LSGVRNSHGTCSHQDPHIRELFEQLETNGCIVELPFSNETIRINELSSYIKSELYSLKHNVNDSVVQALAKCIYQQLDRQPHVFFLLRLVLNESYFSYLSQRKKKLDLTDLNVDQILNAYTGEFHCRSNSYAAVSIQLSSLDHCEQKFGVHICAFIFNYISSCQSAIHEVELLDVLSCNNEFFLEYFPNDFPKHLRFPSSLWIAVKYVLGRQ
jgi:hypothetical protein